jgi:hypothetical protein
LRGCVGWHRAVVSAQRPEAGLTPLTSINGAIGARRDEPFDSGQSVLGYLPGEEVISRSASATTSRTQPAPIPGEWAHCAGPGWVAPQEPDHGRCLLLAVSRAPLAAESQDENAAA